jgi:hypothetical protein
MIAKIFEEEVKNMFKKPYERQLAKKKPYVNGSISLIFLLPKICIRKMMCNRSNFWKILDFLIVKNHFPMHHVES